MGEPRLRARRDAGNHALLQSRPHGQPRRRVQLPRDRGRVAALVLHRGDHPHRRRHPLHAAAPARPHARRRGARARARRRARELVGPPHARTRDRFRAASRRGILLAGLQRRGFGDQRGSRPPRVGQSALGRHASFPYGGRGEVMPAPDDRSVENTTDVVLAKPRGFCAGVDRAIAIVERALALHGAPIYVRHEIVHNKYVVEDLRAKGAVFVEELSEVPAGATVIFSAHGVAKAVRADAERRGLKVFDATCPLVTKVHVEVSKMLRQGYEIVMIGHRGHPEAEGTMGQAVRGMHLVETVEDVVNLRPGSDQLAYVTQTTLSVDDAAAIIAALKARFPRIAGPKKDDICYATQNRQDAVKFMAPQCDVVIVVGSPNSSNSNRLREVSENMGVPAYLVDSAADLRPEWIAGKQRIGITAGASAPEVLVNALIERLRALGARSVRPLEGITESVVFTLPRELARG